MLYALYILDSPEAPFFSDTKVTFATLMENYGIDTYKKYLILCLHTITLEELLLTNSKSTAACIVRLRHTYVSHLLFLPFVFFLPHVHV